MTPDVKVVFFTTHEDSFYAQAAFEVGAKGYLVKQHTDDLKHFLDRILRGEQVQHPERLSHPATDSRIDGGPTKS